MTVLIPDRRPRLRWRRAHCVDVAVVVITAAAWLAAPDFGDGPSTDPTGYFSSVAQVCATLLVAVAFLQGSLGGTVEYRLRRWISSLSFGYLAIATAVGVVGALPSLGDDVSRALFALAAGTGVGGLLTVVLMAYASLREQRIRSDAERAKDLDPT